MAAGLARSATLIVLPVLAGAIALATGADLGAGALATSGIILIASSALLTLGWLVLRRWRRGRIRAIPAAGE